MTAFGQQNNHDSCVTVMDTLTNQKVFKLVDKMPMVHGGMQELFKQVSSRIKHPHIDKYPVDSKIIVAFIVREDGQIIGKRIIKNVNGIGEQLLDIVNDFSWEPGSCNGKNVPTLQIIPLIIDLK